MKTLKWEQNRLDILDQTLLPANEVWKSCYTHEEIAEAIRSLRVRGAPLIGVCAAYGMALAAINAYKLGGFEHSDIEEYIERLEKAKNCLASTRPTAVNLFWALERVTSEIVAVAKNSIEASVNTAINTASAMELEDESINRKIGINGSKVLNDGDNVLTHCNAGALATAGYGTALGVIRAAVESGKKITVFADETRPLLQGSRLTAYELKKDNIPVTVICDNMAAVLMCQKRINCVITGADRIALNGDTANKIGTYGLSVLSKAHGVPFYVAAPFSTVDGSIENGSEIPIEHRSEDEVRNFHGVVTAPDVPCFNPSFDVTPAQNITGIITEYGIARPPFDLLKSRKTFK